MTPVVAMLGLGTGIGMVGIAGVLLPMSSPDLSRGVSHPLESSVRGRGFSSAVVASMRRAAVPIGVGLLCVLVTRWLVAGLLGGLAAATLPSSLHKAQPGATSKTAEAVATWTELIRDSLAASAGLAQAIVVTASSAPVPIRPQVDALATRLANGIPLEAGLRSFALEVDDASAEFLVCALLLAATARSQRLVEVLSALAESVREDVSMNLRVDASRTSARSSVRTIVIFSLVFASALALLAHSYLSPFGTAVGQLVLGAVGLLYALGISLMIRLVRPAGSPRLLEAEAIE